MKCFVSLTIFACCACPAQAQNNVTLYGIIDAGFLYANNTSGNRLYEASPSNQQGDRWGLRGTEDLGGGAAAIFVLENGFNVFNGRLSQGGDEFGRQAYVGLSSRFGTVTFGRQYDSVVDYTGSLIAGAQWATVYGAHPGDLDNMLNTNRTNNAIKYTSVTYAGVKFGALYSLGGISGQFNRNQIWSLGINYTQGPFALGAAYLNVRNPNFSFFGNNQTSSTTSSNMTSNVYSGYASAKTQQVIAVGGTYTMNSATLGVTYSNTQFKDLGQTGPGLNPRGLTGNGKFHNAEINFKYQLTPYWLAGAAYDYTKGYDLNGATYHQAMLGTDYFLSKRTDLYLVGVYQHATGVDSTGHAAVANINNLTASSTANQVAVIVGMRHKF